MSKKNKKTTDQLIGRPHYLQEMCEWPKIEINQRFYGPGSGLKGSRLDDFCVDMSIKTSYLAKIVATGLKRDKIAEIQEVGMNFIKTFYHLTNYTPYQDYYPYYFYCDENGETTALVDFCRFDIDGESSAFLRLDSMSIDELLEVKRKYAMKYKEQEKEWLINQEREICLKVMLGTDYNPRVKGVGASRAKRIVERYRTREEIFKHLKKSKGFDVDFDWVAACRKVGKDLKEKAFIDVELDEPIDTCVGYKADGISDPIQGSILATLITHWVNVLEH